MNIKPLQEVADLIMGQSPPSITYNKAGQGLPFFQGNKDFGSKYPTPKVYCSQPIKIAKDKDVLVSVRAPVGDVNLAPEYESCIGRGLAAIRPKGSLNFLYLYYFMKSIQYWFSKEGVGTTFSAIDKETLANLEIPITEYLEQEEIAINLDRQYLILEQLTKNLSLAKQKAKVFKQTILSAAITGKLTEDWRSNNPNVETASDLLKSIEAGLIKKNKTKKSYFNTEELPEIPDTWIWTNFEHIGELARGKSKHRPRNDPRLFGGEYPFIQTGDVARSKGKISTYTQTYNETGLAQSRLFPKGTLCITIAANIADTGILELDACFPDSVVGFTPYKPIPSADYFYYFVTTAKSNLEQFAPATAQRNINLGILNELAIPLPPLKEQAEIVKRVNNYLEVASLVEKQIEIAEKRVANLTQAILAKTFRSE